MLKVCTIWQQQQKEQAYLCGLDIVFLFLFMYDQMWEQFEQGFNAEQKLQMSEYLSFCKLEQNPHNLFYRQWTYKHGVICMPGMRLGHLT